MRNASPALRALLQSGRAFFMADLYTFVLRDGRTLRYTSADVALYHDGLHYAHDGPLIKRSRTRLTLGLEVDTLSLTLSAGDAHRIGTLPWLHALRHGVLDGAGVTLARLFLADWAGDDGGSVLLFRGEVADVEMGRSEAMLTVRNHLLATLDTELPRHVYQPGCLHTVFQAGCNLQAGAFTVSGTVLGGDTLQLQTSLNQPAGHFRLGHVSLTSGPNAGITRPLRDDQPGLLILASALPAPCQPGDGFTVLPGCDGRRETCRTRFGNEANFRGFPYIPTPETAL